MSDQQSINIPQLVVLLILGFLVFRWYWSSPTGGATGHPGTAGRRVNPAHVEQLVNMFPQLDRRTIMWELQRNGGSVQTATESVLSGRGLATPPPSFQPQMPSPPQSTRQQTRPAKPTHPDLITRYNLSSKLASTSESSETPQKKAQSWSSDKSERSALLQKRREDMILAARRKLEEKEKSGKT